MPFIGKQSSGHSKIKKSRFTATASQTAFSVVSAAGDELQVFLNGVLLKETDDYTYTTSTVTLGTGASVNDIVEVHVYQSFTIADTVDIAGDAMTGELEVPTVKLSSNVIKASDGGSTITLDDSDNVTIGGDLKVTNLKHADSGSNNLVLGSDGSATINQISSSSVFPAGHIIQVEEKTTTGVSTQSSSTDWIDTTLVHSITPKYQSSMIFISYNGIVGISEGTSHTRIDYRVLNNTQSTTVMIKYYYGNDETPSALIQKPLSGIAYDFPSSTSQQTYKIQVRKANGSTTEAGGIAPDWYTGSTHQIVLMEVAQ